MFYVHAVTDHALPHWAGSCPWSLDPAADPLELPLWRFLTASAAIVDVWERESSGEEHKNNLWDGKHVSGNKWRTKCTADNR